MWVVGAFFLSSIIFLSPSLWETARYRLKYRLKGQLSPKQPTNQPCFVRHFLGLLYFYPGWFRRRRLGIVIALSSSASLCKNLVLFFEYLCHYWIYFFETQTSCVLSKEEFTSVGQASQLKMKTHSWALCLKHVSVNWSLSL